MVINANTTPIGSELEYKPDPADVPVIKAVHFRRKFRLGKEIIAQGSLGEYQIILTLANLGNAPLKNLTVLDKVPDHFKYSNFSVEPQITDEVGTDTLRWDIEELTEGDRLEFSYDISGEGEYHPSNAELSY